MRYATFLTPQALARIHTALGGHGTVDVLTDVRQLLAELTLPHDECLVLDPALVTPATAETIAMGLAEFPRSVVAYSSVTTAALESAVVLAQRTLARFVFHGTPNERSALERALLLAPDSELGASLLFLLEPNLSRVSSRLRDRLTAMFRNGEGPYSPTSLAAAAGLARRSLDRCLSDAGFVSACRLIEAARVTSSYRSITGTQIPLKHIASMLGYKSQRTFDQHLIFSLDATSSRLRSTHPSCTDAARRLAQRVTVRESGDEHVSLSASRVTGGARRTLKLIGGSSHPRCIIHIASGNTANNQ